MEYNQGSKEVINHSLGWSLLQCSLHRLEGLIDFVCLLLEHLFVSPLLLVVVVDVAALALALSVHLALALVLAVRGKAVAAVLVVAVVAHA